MNTNRLKQILLLILGIAIMVGLLFIFFYVFIFLVIVGIIYYIYKKIFRRPKNNKINDENKKINPVIIDMDE